MVNQHFKFLKLFLFNRYKILTVITIVLSLLSATLSGFGLGLYIPVISFFLETNQASNVFITISNKVLDILGLQNTLFILIVIATSVIFFGAVITYFTVIISGYICYSITRDVKNHMTSDLLNRPYSWFLKVKTGKVVAILNEQASTASGIVDCFFQLITYTLISTCYLVSLFIISLNLTLIMIVLGGLVLYTNLYFSRKIYFFLKEFQNVKLQQAVSFTETLIGIKTIKSMGLEKYRHRQIAPFIEKERTVIYENHLWYYFQPFFNNVVSITLASVGIYAGLKFFSMSGAEVIVFLLVINRLNASLQNVNRAWLGLTSSFPSVEIVMSYLGESNNCPEQSTKFFKLKESIQLKNVSFAYKDDLVLKDINLKIDRKQFIAFVGSSGGGKTTMIDLIVGLYQPTSGEILYDNQPISYYDRNEFCKHVGVVTQDVFLLNDTIAKNISFGDPSPDIEHVREVAKIAYADEFISKLSKGYETFLGDRGIRVSGGQRQRIALARALYHRPKLLILDEATSALDSESEKCIQKALQKMHGQLTIIAVAHRLSTIREADVIYYIENCVIKEEGTHDMLMKNGTHYKKLKLMQIN